MQPTPAPVGTLRHAALRWSPQDTQNRWHAAHALQQILLALVHQNMDPQVAGPKLAWWNEEAQRLANHQATVPALVALQEWQSSTQDNPAWLQHALDGVARLREQKTPLTLEALCQQWGQWGLHLWWPCAHEGLPWEPHERAYVRALGALDVGMRWCDHWVEGHPEALWVVPHDLRLAHGLTEPCTPDNAPAFHRAWCDILARLCSPLEALALNDAPSEALAIYAQLLLRLARKRMQAPQAGIPRLWPWPLLWHAWRTHTAYRTFLA